MNVLPCAASSLRVGEDLAVFERDLQLGVFAVEVVLEPVQVAGGFPLAHGQVVQQVIAAGLGARRGHFVLG